jgi:antirestriction protein ArdC
MKTADLYPSVTNQLITALEAGTPPWVKPWCQMAEPIPCNALTLRPYRGINLLMLSMAADLQGYPVPRWLTYRQARQVGAQVRKGETATPVLFFATRIPDPETIAAQERQVKARGSVMRTFSVFNVEQVEGLPEAAQPSPVLEPPWAACAMAEHILSHAEAVIHHHPSNRAYYSPSQDRIVLPERSQFPNAESFYSTALHELCHWSGHASRLDRQLGKRCETAYAMEELVAEIGSAFLSAHCRLDGVLQHASYLSFYLDILRADKRAIFLAAGKAQSAADFLLGKADLLSEPETALAA